MNNNNKHLIHYLNSEVKVYHKDYNDYFPLVIENNTPSAKGGYNINECLKYRHLPLLYPLSCLTTPISHNGKTIISLVELAKIEGGYTGEDYLLNKDKITWYRGINKYLICSFSYNHKLQYFEKKIGVHYITCSNNLKMFQALYDMRINVFDIEAINPLELGENNPYLITDVK